MIQFGKIKNNPHQPIFVNWTGYGCNGTLNENGNIKLRILDWEKYDTFYMRGYNDGYGCDSFIKFDCVEIKGVFECTNTDYPIFKSDSEPPLCISSCSYYEEYIKGKGFDLIFCTKQRLVICTNVFDDFVKLADELVNFYNTKFITGLQTKGVR